MFEAYEAYEAYNNAAVPKFAEIMQTVLSLNNGQNLAIDGYLANLMPKIPEPVGIEAAGTGNAGLSPKNIIRQMTTRFTAAATFANYNAIKSAQVADAGILQPAQFGQFALRPANTAKMSSIDPSFPIRMTPESSLGWFKIM